MSLPYILDDYDVEGFLRLAADFGGDKFGHVMTPNVDHLICYHDDPGFRALYADASYVPGPRVFSLPPHTKILVRPRMPLPAATTGATEPVLH
jgi:hypothetical protein